MNVPAGQGTSVNSVSELEFPELPAAFDATT
jgi:hypothetical protein